jgi:tryptophan synthase alpha chain
MLRSSRGHTKGLNNLITNMNRIDKLFNSEKNNILSIYFTAGYPNLDSTAGIIRTLAEAGADMIEIGIPFSDPMADGPVIQHSNQVALQNGMNLKLLFNQLSDIRKKVEIPLLLMGYLNPVMQFGIENFCSECSRNGIDGVIIPDLPPRIFTEEYISFFNEYDLYNILLISPQSSDDRISALDKISRGFIYMVSSSSVTGTKNRFTDDQISYFRRVQEMDLKNPCLIGFGISNNETFADACRLSRGGIIGSGFIKILEMKGDSTENIFQYIKDIKNQKHGEI